MLRSMLDFLGAWKPFFPGVKRKVILSGKRGSTGIVLLRYKAGARVPRHYHEGKEIIYVISGSQGDESGEYGAGALVVNETGSDHSLYSREGCLVLLIYEKPVRFLESYSESVS